MADSSYSFSCSIQTDKQSYSSSDPVRLSFELTNSNNCDLYVLKWHTPLEGLYNKYLKVTVGGEDVPYRGIMAKRGNPPAESYVLIQAGASVSGSVDIGKGYDTSSPGSYSVELKTRLMDVVPRKEGVDFVASKLDQMNSVPISCDPVEFDVVVD